MRRDTRTFTMPYRVRLCSIFQRVSGHSRRVRMRNSSDRRALLTNLAHRDAGIVRARFVFARNETPSIAKYLYALPYPDAIFSSCAYYRETIVIPPCPFLFSRSARVILSIRRRSNNNSVYRRWPSEYICSVTFVNDSSS